MQEGNMQTICSDTHHGKNTEIPHGCVRMASVQLRLSWSWIWKSMQKIIIRAPTGTSVGKGEWKETDHTSPIPPHPHKPDRTSDNGQGEGWGTQQLFVSIFPASHYSHISQVIGLVDLIPTHCSRRSGVRPPEEPEHAQGHGTHPDACQGPERTGSCSC